MAEQRDGIRVPPKGLDVVLHPYQGGYLVHEAEVARWRLFGPRFQESWNEMGWLEIFFYDFPQSLWNLVVIIVDKVIMN